MKNGKYYGFEVKGELLGEQVFPETQWTLPQAWAIAQDYEADLLLITYEDDIEIGREVLKSFQQS